MDMEKSRQQLIARLTENYADYRAELLLKDRQELIDGAGKIADTAVVFHHLAERRYTEQELSYLLNFQNPLETSPTPLPLFLLYSHRFVRLHKI